MSWLRERLPFDSIVQSLMDKRVPRHRYTYWYLLGGATLFFLVIEMFTGVLLTFYYVPTPDRAHDSVREIIGSVRQGWFVRSLHGWCANVLIVFALVHMFSVFFLRAYRRPREVMWFTGVAMFFTILGFAFTGHLLPWNTSGYFATLMGTEVARSLPVVGEPVARFLKGGTQFGAMTLTRLYSIHITILPLSLLFLVIFHLLVNHASGSSVPIGITVREKPIPFFPNFFYRDILFWLSGFLLLVTLAVVVPWELGDGADPSAPAPSGIRPQWYFLPLYQALRAVPVTVAGLGGAAAVNLVVLFGSVLWLLVPILDRKAAREEHSRFFSVIGASLIICLIGGIILAWTT